MFQIRVGDGVEQRRLGGCGFGDDSPRDVQNGSLIRLVSLHTVASNTSACAARV